MKRSAKLDGRVAELDALAENPAGQQWQFTDALRLAWRTWLRNAALRGLDPKGGQDLPLASDDASGVGTGAIASSVERSPASPAGLDPKPTEHEVAALLDRARKSLEFAPRFNKDGYFTSPDADLISKLLSLVESLRSTEQGWVSGDIAEAFEQLRQAAAMEAHNDAIFKGKWKKGSKAWSGEFIEKTRNDAFAKLSVLAAAAPSAAGRESEGDGK
jgi:hypothetical protein